MKRTMIAALAAALMGTGCVDLGLQGNVPEDESAMAPPTDLVAAVMAPVTDPPLIVGGRQWLPAGPAEGAGLQELVPVGSAMGQTVYARAWDGPPYDALFTRLDADRGPLEIEAREWQRHLPVLGGSGAGHDETAHANEAEPASAAH